MKQLIFSLILGMAQEKGYDPYNIAAIAFVESSLNYQAIGEMGELGVFQLRPEFYFKEHQIIDLQTYFKTAFDLLELKRDKCGKALLPACWNIGITKALKLGVDKANKGVYTNKVRRAREEIKKACESKSKSWNKLRCTPVHF